MCKQVARAKVRAAGSFVQYTIHFVPAPLRMAVRSPEFSLKLPHHLRNWMVSTCRVGGLEPRGFCNQHVHYHVLARRRLSMAQQRPSVEYDRCEAFPHGRGSHTFGVLSLAQVSLISVYILLLPSDTSACLMSRFRLQRDCHRSQSWLAYFIRIDVQRSQG